MLLLVVSSAVNSPLTLPFKILAGTGFVVTGIVGVPVEIFADVKLLKDPSFALATTLSTSDKLST